MGQSGYYKWEPHAFQKRLWQMAGKPPGRAGVKKGNKIQTGELPSLGSTLVPLVTTWPGHPGKAFNPLLRPTGWKKEPHHWAVVRSKADNIGSKHPRNDQAPFRWLTLLLNSSINIIIINNGKHLSGVCYMPDNTYDVSPRLTATLQDRSNYPHH